MNELETLAKPLKGYLKTHYHPHAVIVVTNDKVLVMETLLSLPETIPKCNQDSGINQWCASMLGKVPDGKRV